MTTALSSSYPIERIRADFPILGRTVHNGVPLVYLDSAATSQKPRAMVERMSQFYYEEYATVRRGVYSLSQHSTALYEGVRRQAAVFLGAEHPEEIVYVRGVTEGMNLLATAWGRKFLKAGDEVILTRMEHHSNIVPWQMACEATGATLRMAEMLPSGELDMDNFAAMLSPRTKLVSVVHVSNGLGTINPIAEITRLAHEVGALVVVDGAQSAPHLPIDVRAMDADFFVCSGHKMLGPTGIGLLYGKLNILREIDPYQGGGEMIVRVTFGGSTYEEPPYRFEAGTPAFAEVVGLGAAMTYMDEIGRENIEAWDQHILRYCTERMQEIPGMKFYGTAANKSGIVAFRMGDIHPSDIGTILDREGICIRVGQHCLQPVMDYYQVPATARASFGPYTTTDDIDRFIDGLRTVQDLMG